MTDKNIDSRSLISGSTIAGKDPEGHWVLGKTNSSAIYLAIYKKPNRFHRFMTKVLLGWEWKDYKNPFKRK